MKVFTATLALILLTVACASHSQQVGADEMVVVAGYRSSDLATGELVSQTLHQHGIDGVGAVHAGWVDLNVRRGDAARARKLLLRLNKTAHPVTVVNR